SRSAEFRARGIHRVNLGSGNNDDILFWIHSRRNRPQNFRVVEDIHVLIDGDGYLRMLILAGKDRQQHVSRLAVVARVHLHHDTENSRQHQDVFYIGEAAYGSDAAQDLRRHGNFVIDATLDFGAVLDVLKNGIVSHRDRLDIHDWIHSSAGKVIILKLTERTFLFAQLGWDFAFQDDFRVRGDFEI